MQRLPLAHIMDSLKLCAVSWWG